MGTPLALVVDDDPMFANSFARFLTTEGAEVRIARDGHEALRQIARHEWARLDIALLDVTMPGLSGPELAAIIREENPRTEITIVSGMVDADAIQRELSVLNVAFFTKPFPEGGARRWAKGVCARSRPRVIARKLEQVIEETSLSGRASEILRYAATTSTDCKDIARAFDIEPSTAKHHVKNILQKTGAPSLRDLVSGIKG